MDHTSVFAGAGASNSLMGKQVEMTNETRESRVRHLYIAQTAECFDLVCQPVLTDAGWED